MISYFFEDIDELSLQQSEIEKNIEKLIEKEGKIPGDISYIFCSDDYLLEINKQYLNHDYYTDVITFDYCENGIISGDIFISVDTIKSNAQEYSVTFEKELQRVMIHGVLHLVGYKDKQDDDQKVMRSKEDEYLQLFE